MKYRKSKKSETWGKVIGMLYIVEVRMTKKATSEIIKHKLLVVGCETSDIEKKLKWIFDATKYDSFSISSVEKVREKIHTLSTTIKQEKPASNPVIKQGDKTIEIPQGKTIIEDDNVHLYAIGITTTMIGCDEDHALRKVGHAIISSTTEVDSNAGATLSDNSTVHIEEVPFSTGHAKPKDVSIEKQSASFVRG